MKPSVSKKFAMPSAVTPIVPKLNESLLVGAQPLAAQIPQRGYSPMKPEWRK